MLARWPFGWRRRLGLVALAAGLASPRGPLAAQGPPTAPSPRQPPPLAAPALETWRRALTESAYESLVHFPEAGGGAAVETALLTRATPESLLAVAMDARAYCRAVPSLVTCKEIGSERLADGRWRRRVEWELEIPLANLSGQLEVEPDGDWLGVSLRFVHGDLAPGSMHVRWQAGRDGATVLWAALAANLRDANWLLRRLARRDAWTEPAMRGAIVWIAAIALSALAATPGAASAPRPHGASARWSGGGREKDAVLAGLVAPLRGSRSGTWAAIERAPNGRLLVVRVARQSSWPATDLLHALATQRGLSSLVGWSKLRVTSTAADHALAEVKEDIPFVDLEADWRINYGPPLAADAVAGAIAGAAWRFSTPGQDAKDVTSARSGAAGTGGPQAGVTKPEGVTAGSTVVFSLAPRLEAAGWVPRRFIEAEPLLEHGLALALAYVDLRTVLDATFSDKGRR